MAIYLIELLGPAGIIASSLLITVGLFSGAGYLIGLISKMTNRNAAPAPVSQKR